MNEKDFQHKYQYQAYNRLADKADPSYGYKFDMPNPLGYVMIVTVGICCLIMQFYVPYKLAMQYIGADAKQVFVGVKKVTWFGQANAYTGEPNWQSVFFGMIPLLLI